jgi:hypothetical protein
MVFCRYWTNWATGWTSELVSQSPHRFTHRSGFWIIYLFSAKNKDFLRTNLLIKDMCEPMFQKQFACGTQVYWTIHVRLQRWIKTKWIYKRRNIDNLRGEICTSCNNFSMIWYFCCQINIPPTTFPCIKYTNL